MISQCFVFYIVKGTARSARSASLTCPVGHRRILSGVIEMVVKKINNGKKVFIKNDDGDTQINFKNIKFNILRKVKMNMSQWRRSAHFQRDGKYKMLNVALKSNCGNGVKFL